MRAQIDKICNETGVWPHAVLSAHAHNFQRFTRVHQSMEPIAKLGWRGELLGSEG
jgi:hypothetical protein